MIISENKQDVGRLIFNGFLGRTTGRDSRGQDQRTANQDEVSEND
jgi:hypothetical protein